MWFLVQNLLPVKKNIYVKKNDYTKKYFQNICYNELHVQCRYNVSLSNDIIRSRQTVFVTYLLPCAAHFFFIKICIVITNTQTQVNNLAKYLQSRVHETDNLAVLISLALAPVVLRDGCTAEQFSFGELWGKIMNTTRNSLNSSCD